MAKTSKQIQNLIEETIVNGNIKIFNIAEISRRINVDERSTFRNFDKAWEKLQKNLKIIFKVNNEQES